MSSVIPMFCPFFSHGQTTVIISLLLQNFGFRQKKCTIKTLHLIKWLKNDHMLTIYDDDIEDKTSLFHTTADQNSKSSKKRMWKWKTCCFGTQFNVQNCGMEFFFSRFPISKIQLILKICLLLCNQDLFD